MVLDLTQAIQPQYGWMTIILWFGWQSVSAKHIPGHEPLLYPLFELSDNLDRLEDVEDKQDSIFENVQDLRNMQEKHIQVSRAHSRALDEGKDVSVTSDAVDEYLLDNGVAIETFLDSSDVNNSQSDDD